MAYQKKVGEMGAKTARMWETNCETGEWKTQECKKLLGFSFLIHDFPLSFSCE